MYATLVTERGYSSSYCGGKIFCYIWDKVYRELNKIELKVRCVLIFKILTSKVDFIAIICNFLILILL